MPAKDAPRIRAQLDELLAVIRMRVADDVYRSVQSIRDAVIFTLDHAGEQDQADPNVYLVRQTAIAYLPEALSTYVALPRIYAERQPIDGGRTSHDILLEQLYLMDIKVAPRGRGGAPSRLAAARRAQPVRHRALFGRARSTSAAILPVERAAQRRSEGPPIVAPPLSSL